MKIIDDDGTEIQISEKTAQNIRDARKPKKEGREKHFDAIRVSETYLKPGGLDLVIRISVLHKCSYGRPMGKFYENGGDRIPGEILNKRDARKLANYILELCNELEKK